MRKNGHAYRHVVAVLATALMLMVGFWFCLETYMVDSAVVPAVSDFGLAVPGTPAVSARLYWLGTPRLRGEEYLLVLTSKSAEHREFYWINMDREEIGIPECPKYVPLLGSAVVERTTLVGYPLELELKAEWNVGETDIRIRIMGFSDRAMKPRPDDDENARAMMPIAYQREIVLTKLSSR